MDEGSLSIRLYPAQGLVERVEIDSSRPLQASRLFLGKPVHQVLNILPLLFSVCSTAQSAAAVAACEQALDLQVSAPQQQARELLLHVETVREHLLRVLIGWSEWLGERPVAEALAVVGRTKLEVSAALYPQRDAYRPGGGQLQPDPQRLAAMLQALDGVLQEQVLGLPPAQWSELRTLADLQAWSSLGRGIAARLIDRVLKREWAVWGRSPVSALGETSAGTLAGLLQGPEAEHFIAQPTWRGRTRETGALAREQAQPLLRDLSGHGGNGLLTRLTARLSELVQLQKYIYQLAGSITETSEGQAGKPAEMHRQGGSGVGQVEAARGRLIHWVDVAGSKVRGYRILAPTEWNFHPQGVFAQGLIGLPIDEHLPELTRLLIEAVDPCVGYRLELM